MFVYMKSRTEQLWTVGFYEQDDPDHQWHPVSDHSTETDAIRRINFLNGGDGSSDFPL